MANEWRTATVINCFSKIPGKFLHSQCRRKKTLSEEKKPQHDHQTKKPNFCKKCPQGVLFAMYKGSHSANMISQLQFEIVLVNFFRNFFIVKVEGKKTLSKENKL